MIEEPNKQRNRGCEPQRLLSTAAAPMTCQAFAIGRLPPHCSSGPHAPLLSSHLLLIMPGGTNKAVVGLPATKGSAALDLQPGFGAGREGNAEC